MLRCDREVLQLVVIRKRAIQKNVSRSQVLELEIEQHLAVNIFSLNLVYIFDKVFTEIFFLVVAILAEL